MNTSWNRSIRWESFSVHVTLFLVKGQSHYDIINLKNHYLYMWCQRHSRPQNRVLAKKKQNFFSICFWMLVFFIIAKLVACPSGALLTKYSVVYKWCIVIHHYVMYKRKKWENSGQNASCSNLQTKLNEKLWDNYTRPNASSACPVRHLTTNYDRSPFSMQPNLHVHWFYCKMQLVLVRCMHKDSSDHRHRAYVT